MAPLQSALKYFHDDFERHISSRAMSLEQEVGTTQDLGLD